MGVHLKKKEEVTRKVTNLNHGSQMICTEVVGKWMFSEINHSAFYLKEKCDNSLIFEMFSVVVRGKGKNKSVNWLNKPFWTLKMGRGMCQVNCWEKLGSENNVERKKSFCKKRKRKMIPLFLISARYEMLHFLSVR